MRIPVRQNNRSGLGVHMTPLIDIVFLLIIFFLVASHVVKSQHAVAVELPASERGEREDDSQANRVTLTIRADGQLFLGSDEASRDEVINRLTQLSADTSDDPVQVRIRGDRRAAFAHLRPLLRACAENGIGKIDFAVADDE